MKIMTAWILSLVSTLSFAEMHPHHPALDKVVFQLSAKQWVTTETVLLKVNVNATLTNADLVKARADIMERLNKIAVGNWHLTQFDRSQDSSGLEKLFVEAQTRVAQSGLTDIYKNAKDVSQPGSTYSINGVEFKPSLEEIQKVRSQLRTRLYADIQNELNQLNTTYNSQHYTINRVYIVDGDAAPQPMAYRAQQMKTMVMSASVAAPTLAVSNEMTMSALVEAASNRVENGSVASVTSNK